MRVRIVTDSSANVPDTFLERLGIAEALAMLNFGSTSYLNKIEISLAEFYRQLETAVTIPTTSQPTPGQFANAYARVSAEGADAIIAVVVSARLSGTYNSAVVAAEQAAVPVHVWDSWHASMGAGWQAIAAAEMARDGLDVPGILTRLEPIRARMRLVCTPANLKYIIASGRVPRLRGAIGDLLNIKPILSAADGLLEPTSQVRTQRRALETMLEQMAHALGGRPARVAVGHCNVPDQVVGFMAAVRDRLNVAEGFIFDLGPVLAALGGPGLMGMAAYTLEE